MIYRFCSFLTFLSFFIAVCLQAKLPEIAPRDVTFKAKELMKAHAMHKRFTLELMQRILINYLESLDPNKTYFILSDIENWQHCDQKQLEQIIYSYYKSDFSCFVEIHNLFLKAIARRENIEQVLNQLSLPENVKASEFKEMQWAVTEEDLKNRLLRIRSLQAQTMSHLEEKIREKAKQRIIKAQKNFEKEALESDPIKKERLILSNILKATASSLDSHSAYFTPGEAAQFMIDVQHRLCGIGAQLRDDLDGITIVKILEGGPASASKELKEKDRIIAVDDEPIVGMEMTQAVEMIRGPENTPVKLTIVRELVEKNQETKEQQLEITLTRGEVVIKEMRFDSQYEPYGAGAIGYIKLYSFYEDQKGSCAEDVKKEIMHLKSSQQLQGLILDLRYNCGGLLNQAVDVTGLFISTGIAVSIKDENGQVQHLRVIDKEVVWDGPLIILVSRMSASASEIVAQTLQDYGRAIVVGDAHTFGKGSFQTFTLSSNDPHAINPEGEFKVTRGRYYTVSGKTPQLVGVTADICVPSLFCQKDIGEKHGKFPLSNDAIAPNFIDTLSDLPDAKKRLAHKDYAENLQKPITLYKNYLPLLKENSSRRIAASANYQNFLKEAAKKEEDVSEEIEKFGLNDLQLEEANQIMKDLLLLLTTTDQQIAKAA